LSNPAAAWYSVRPWPDCAAIAAELKAANTANAVNVEIRFFMVASIPLRRFCYHPPRDV
jgi:hypothetical protein